MVKFGFLTSLLPGGLLLIDNVKLGEICIIPKEKGKFISASLLQKYLNIGGKDGISFAKGKKGFYGPEDAMHNL